MTTFGPPGGASPSVKLRPIIGRTPSIGRTLAWILATRTRSGESPSKVADPSVQRPMSAKAGTRAFQPSHSSYESQVWSKPFQALHTPAMLCGLLWGGRGGRDPSLDAAKERRGGADAEGERDGFDGGEAGAAEERAGGEADVA